MSDRLLLIEPGQIRRPLRPLSVGQGHWVEAVEAFSSAWPGETALIGHAPNPNIESVDQFIELSSGELMRTHRTFRILLSSRLARLSSNLLAGGISSRLLRTEWESFVSAELASVLARELHLRKSTTVFAPTAIPSVVETIVRSARAIAPKATEGTKFLVRFSSQGHERRYLHPRTFALQLRRWQERAGSLALNFGVEVESVATELATHSGLPVSWVPWPVLPPSQKVGTDHESDPRKIFIYARRPEQGARKILGLVRSLVEHFDDRVEICASVDNSSLAGLSAAEHEALRSFERLTLISESVSPSALRSTIGRCGVVILPYEVQSYRRRGSALMWASLDEGVPMIAPTGTGFGEEIGRNGIGFTYGLTSEIPALVSRALERKGGLRATIERYQGRRAVAVSDYFASGNSAQT